MLKPRIGLIALALMAAAGTAACGSSNADGTGGSAGAGGSAGTAGSACEAVQRPTGDTRFDGVVNTVRTLTQGAAAVVAVYADGKLREAILGSANPASCEPVRMTTRFNGVRLADVVTALTALRLQEKGKVDLDAPVRNYVPDLKLDAASEKWAPELTLRSLLSFSSGYYPYYWWPDDPGPCPSAPAFQTVAGDPGPGTLKKFFSTFPGPIYHEPGTQWMFGNPGFALAARALEEEEGKPFAKVVQTEVAEPSGLDLTYDPAVYKNGDLAQPLSALSDCELVWPNRGLYLDAKDLGKLLQAIAGGGDSVVSKSEVNALLTRGLAPATADVGSSSLGFAAVPSGLGTLVDRNGHDGDFAQGQFVVIPKRHFGFAFNTNERTALGYVLQAVFKAYFPNVTVRYNNATDPATWTDYEGTYQRDDKVEAVIKADTVAGTLSATIGGQEVAMTPSGFQAFFSMGVELKKSIDVDYFQLAAGTFQGGNVVRFYRDANGTPTTLGFFRGDGGELSHPFYRMP